VKFVVGDSVVINLEQINKSEDEDSIFTSYDKPIKIPLYTVKNPFKIDLYEKSIILKDAFDQNEAKQNEVVGCFYHTEVALVLDINGLEVKLLTPNQVVGWTIFGGLLQRITIIPPGKV